MAQALTTPGNITKVPRGVELCNSTQTDSELPAGQPSEIVFLVDAMRYDPSAPQVFPFVPHRYQAIRLWVMPPTGTALTLEYQVSDAVPACPVGTIHAGMRPHTATVPALTPGQYRLMGVMLDKQSSGLLRRIPDVTPIETVTVK